MARPCLIGFRSIANNAEIDTIWETWRETLEPQREALNTELDTSHEEWQIPREADDDWSAEAKRLHAEWWEGRIARQREIAVDENDEFVGVRDAAGARTADEMDFADVVMEHLKTAGVQQSAKEDRISFSTVQGWPGKFIAAEGRYVEGESEDAPERRAGIFIGPRVRYRHAR